MESVASIFRLEEVAVGFSETLTPFKLHDVTAQKTIKLKLSKIIENRAHIVTISNRYCNRFLMVLCSHDKTSVVPSYYSVWFFLQLYMDLEIRVFLSAGE